MKFHWELCYSVLFTGPEDRLYYFEEIGGEYEESEGQNADEFFLELLRGLGPGDELQIERVE